MKLIRFIKKHFEILILIASILYLVHLFYLPDYEIYNSFSLNNSVYSRETELHVIVHKARYNPVLYEEIAEEHNDINGIPNKLTLKLYTSIKKLKAGKQPYRIIVFNYDKDLKYILLDP